MTIFEKIAKGEIPSYKIWEDEDYLAFLDINPIAKGHVLVVPKENPGDKLFELEDDQYIELQKRAKLVAGKIKQALDVDRVFMIVEGIEVPHVHIHLIPARPGFTLHKSKKIDLSEAEFKEIQGKFKNV